jgi:hypothetical protein
MSETNNENLEQAIDPPDNTGGTGGSAAISLTPVGGTEPVDPPDNNGGTGKTTVRSS